MWECKTRRVEAVPDRLTLNFKTRVPEWLWSCACAGLRNAKRSSSNYPPHQFLLQPCGKSLIKNPRAFLNLREGACKGLGGEEFIEHPLEKQNGLVRRRFNHLKWHVSLADTWNWIIFKFFIEKSGTGPKLKPVPDKSLNHMAATTGCGIVQRRSTVYIFAVYIGFRRQQRLGAELP